MKRLRSPHVMNLYAVSVEPGRLCYVMPDMKSGDLRSYLDNQSLTPAQQYRIALQIAKGLHYLHRMGVIHSDLKSANVLLDEQLNDRISDFGLSKSQNQQSLSTLGKTTEDFQWVAPEVLHNRSPSKQSDIYSLGIILWELCTGKKPYESYSSMSLVRKISNNPNFRETIPDNVPKAYRELIEMCWATKPYERASLEEVIRGLQKLAPRGPEQERSMGAASSTSSSRSVPLAEVPQRDLFFGNHSATPSPAPTPAVDPTLSAEDWYMAGYQYESQKNMEAAARCYLQAVAGEHTKAKTNLGMFHFNGQGGLAQDKGKAVALWLAAANDGHIRAMDNLAYCYRHGDGVSANLLQATHWENSAKTLRQNPGMNMSK